MTYLSESEERAMDQAFEAHQDRLAAERDDVGELDCPGCFPNGHSACSDLHHFTCPDHVALGILVENSYVDGYEENVNLVVFVERPEQGLSEDDLIDWASEHLLEFTGTDTGRENVDALYIVTVTDSSAPYLVPSGSTWEWSG